MRRTRFVTRVFALAVMIFIIGCVLEETYKGPQNFDPEYLLRQELSHPEPQKHEMVIVPEDLNNRPELKNVITRYMSIKQSDSDVAALAFVQDVIERDDATIAPRDLADLKLIHATALYGRARFMEAESSCDRAIELDSKNWRAIHFRAMLREKRGSDEEFRADMRRVSEVRGKSIRLFSTRAGVI